jgi:alpha,alpha-trehalase
MKSMHMKFSAIIVACFLYCLASTTAHSQTYCPKPFDFAEQFGELFEKVQLKRLFPDSKVFPDALPRFPPQDIMNQYHESKSQPNFDLERFVQEHFTLPAHDQAPESITDYIQGLWHDLERPGRSLPPYGSTLIPLPYDYIVPGGRFREIYYWDSYFTMLGLRQSGEIQTIENMVKNFAYLIDCFGFIPNGNRSYYLGRSQPPFFAQMVWLLAEVKGQNNPDKKRQVVRRYVPQIEREYTFWMDGSDRLTAEHPTHRRVVRMADGMVLNRFWDDQDSPRPESYLEDVETAEIAARLGKERDRVYRDLRAGGESGWDFSSRWLLDGKSLFTIHTTDIIPVDLNAILYGMEMMLAEFHPTQKARYLARAEARKQAMLRYCWDQERQFFTDYDFVSRQPKATLSLAGVFPLYFNIATQEQARAVAAKLQQDFLDAGGLTTTLAATGQQWDKPNGWAPLHWVAIQGLRQYGFHELATTIRDRWLQNNREVYRVTGKLMEKYNVVQVGKLTGGGEYELQEGFGWTNGVFLRLASEPPPAPLPAPAPHLEGQTTNAVPAWNQQAFLAAIEDAAVPQESEVAKLIAITDDNPALVWRDPHQKQQLRVAIFMTNETYTAHYAPPYPRTGTTPAGTPILWVTLVPQVQHFCQNLGLAGPELTHRLKQYLGLAPNKPYMWLVEMWVDRHDLFRPCPDPETDDAQCALRFQKGRTPTVPRVADYRTFFRSLYPTAYGVSGAPWTRLGYTYDWGPGGREFGASEFMVAPGSSYEILGATQAEEYCRR